MKKCTKCGKEYPANSTYFNKDKKVKSGLYCHCKECTKEVARQYYQENKEGIKKRVEQYAKDNDGAIREYRKEHYIENKERIDKNNRAWNEENKERVVEYQSEYYLENRKEILKNVHEYNKSNLIKIKRVKKAYYLNNREGLLKKEKNYREENKDHVNRLQRAWSAKNKPKVRAWGKDYYKRNKSKYIVYAQKRRHLKREVDFTLTAGQWEEIKSHFDNRCAYCGMEEKECLREYNTKLHQDHFVPLSKNGEFTHNNIVPSCKGCNSSKSNKDFFDWYPSHTTYTRDREQFVLNYLGYNKNVQQLSIL